MKKTVNKHKKCDKCGKKVHVYGFQTHYNRCEGDAKPVAKRKYTKQKTAKTKKSSNMVVYADVRMEIDLTKALKLGIAKVVQG